MKKSLHATRLLLAQLKLAAMVAVFGALSTSSVAAQGNNGSEDDEVYVLNPFVVETDSVQGYATTSSLGASRIAVPVTELASTTVTINENLIEDTLAQDLRDTLNLIAGVVHGNQGTGNQLSQIFSLRGYTVNSATRDGLPSLMFTTVGGFDYSLVQRIEIIKGPNGVIYGSHNPGGVVNITSKMPLSEPMTKIEARVGSFDYYRAALDHSGLSSDKKFGYRLAATYWDWDGPAELPNEPGGTLVFNPSVSYSFDNGFRVWGYYAHVNDEATNRRPRLSYGFGMRTDEHLGRPVPHRRIAEEGETYSNLWQNLSSVEIDAFEVGTDKAFATDTFSGAFRFVARHEERLSNASRIRGTGQRNYLAANDVLIGTESRDLTIAQVDDELVRITRNSTRWDDLLNDTEQNFVGLDLTFDLNFLGARHQILTYAQWTDVETSDSIRTTDVNFTTLPQSVLDEFGWDNGRIEMWPNPTYAPINTEFMREFGGESLDRGTTVSTNEIFAWGAMDRISFLDNRLIFIGGLRHDSVDQSSVFSVELNPLIERSTLKDSDWTQKLGAVGKIYDTEKGEVALFYNNGETFTIESRIDKRKETQGQALPNRNTSTDEIGLKIDLFDSRVAATISYFDTEETNFLVGRRDDLAGTVTGIPAPEGSILGEAYLAPAGIRTSEGFEMDVTVSPLLGLNLVLSYSNIDTELTEGRVVGVPDETFGAFIHYRFQEGFLNGFSIAWQYNAWGDSDMEPSFAAPATDRSQLDGDSVQHLILGYELNENWKFGFKIDNLWDDFVVRPSTFWTGIGLEPERSFRLSVEYRM